MHSKNNHIKNTWFHLIAIGVVVIWGTTFISTKTLLSQGLSPEEIFFYRFLLAYIGMWFLGKSPLFAKNVKDEVLFILLGIFGGSLYFLAENFALKITLASNVALIVCTAPILTAICSHVFLKTEKLTRNLIHGSFIALFGVAFVVFNGSFILKITPLGDFLSLLAALSWAFYTILLKRISHSSYSTLFITRKVFFYGILTITPMFIFRPLTTEISILSKPVIWGNFLYLGLVASLACYVLWNMTVKHLGAIRTTNYIYIIPVVTLLASMLILDEIITIIALVGAVLILGGVILAERRVFQNK